MPKAQFSTRALNKDITLNFGLVNIPINLFTGTVSQAGVTKHEYLPVTRTEKVMDDDISSPTYGQEIDKEVVEDHPVGRGLTDKVTGELLTEDEKAAVIKKIETEDGPVWVEDHEVEQLFTLEADTLKVKTFQPQHLFHTGQYVPKSLMFIEPVQTGTGKKKGYNQATLKLFGTLLKAMREEGVVAVGELTTRGVPKPVILTPDGALWQVWHTDAIREQRELPEVNLVDAEVKMMGSLIDAMKSTEPLDLSDTRSELIQNFADEKAAAGDFDKSSDTYVKAPPAEASVDLMAMLAASVEAAKAS